MFSVALKLRSGLVVLIFVKIQTWSSNMYKHLHLNDFVPLLYVPHRTSRSWWGPTGRTGRASCSTSPRSTNTLRPEVKKRSWRPMKIRGTVALFCPTCQHDILISDWSNSDTRRKAAVTKKNCNQEFYDLIFAGVTEHLVLRQQLQLLSVQMRLNGNLMALCAAITLVYVSKGTRPPENVPNLLPKFNYLCMIEMKPEVWPDPVMRGPVWTWHCLSFWVLIVN